MTVTRWRFVQLLALRYRLQWAYVRRTPGRLALFVFVQSVVAVILVAGGTASLGLAGVAARAGRGAHVIRTLIDAVYLDSLAAALLLGLGMNQVFSEEVLRRYPLSRVQRLMCRQILGLFEPLWLVTLAVYLGAAMGMSAFGGAAAGIGVPAALLLVATSYLLARVGLWLGERLMAARAWPFVAVVLLTGVAVLAISHRAVSRAIPPALLAGAMAITPPRLAGDIMAGTLSSSGLFGLVSWCVLLAGLLMVLEARQPVGHRNTDGAIPWPSTYDRIASRVPGVSGPLVARALRYCLRNGTARANLVLAIPGAAFLIYGLPGETAADPAVLFERALLFIPMAGAFSTAGLTTNVFGAEASGFRRLLLTPVEPSVSLRAIAVAQLIIALSCSCMAVALWIGFAPVATDARMAVMLLAQAFTGVLIFHALALWSSLLSPRRTPYRQRFGSRFSTGGQLVFGAGMLLILVVPAVSRHYLAGPVRSYWWLPPIALAVAALLYEAGLRGATRLFIARRERLLSVVEGRNG